jgi:hypothetical protein
MDIWHIFSLFGMFFRFWYVLARKIWQPCKQAFSDDLANCTSGIVKAGWSCAILTKAPTNRSFPSEKSREKRKEFQRGTQNFGGKAQFNNCKSIGNDFLSPHFFFFKFSFLNFIFHEKCFHPNKTIKTSLNWAGPAGEAC